MNPALQDRAKRDVASERIRDMDDAETAAYLREWVRHPHDAFAWPTDGCGKAQHARFVAHRNAQWQGDTVVDWLVFILDYSDLLDPLEVA